VRVVEAHAQQRRVADQAVGRRGRSSNEVTKTLPPSGERANTQIAIRLFAAGVPTGQSLMSGTAIKARSACSAIQFTSRNSTLCTVVLQSSQFR
jgi:hypothetical protein